jgi:hypothetical protein
MSEVRPLCAFRYPNGEVCGLPAWADGGAAVHTTLRFEEDPASLKRRGANPRIEPPPHRFVSPTERKENEKRYARAIGGCV